MMSERSEDVRQYGGKNPRTMPVEILRKLLLACVDGCKVERRARLAILEGRGRGTLNYAIRAKCLDCCCWQPGEVSKCTAVHCPLWPFRNGENPFRLKRELSERQRLALGLTKSGESQHE